MISIFRLLLIFLMATLAGQVWGVGALSVENYDYDAAIHSRVKAKLSPDHEKRTYNQPLISPDDFGNAKGFGVPNQQSPYFVAFIDGFLAAKSGTKIGVPGGKGAGKGFSNKVKDQARAESRDTCVFCRTKTTRQPGSTRSEIDHAIPKSRNGNNSLENAQNTCRTCNRQKGAKTTDEFLQ